MYRQKHTRRQISKFLTKDIAEIQENRKRHMEYLEKEAQKKTTNESKRRVKRQNLLQQLDKRNKKANLEQRIINTIFFYDELIIFIKQEYSLFTTLNPNFNFLDLTTFAKPYVPHIKNLQKFDEEVEFNEELGYTKPLTEQLCEELEKINPDLVKLFSLEPAVLLSM